MRVCTGFSVSTLSAILNVDDHLVGQSRSSCTAGSVVFPSGSFPLQYPFSFPSLITAWRRRRRWPDERQAETIPRQSPIGSFSNALAYA
jgi:hypothetical protein